MGFEPYFYHPEADVSVRRDDSEYCLNKLLEWTTMIDRNDPPAKCNVDWTGAWLSPECRKRWRRDYAIQLVEPIDRPQHHPKKNEIQKNAIRMILPAKGILPVGSYNGSPGFGLIHANTISAAILHDGANSADSNTRPRLARLLGEAAIRQRNNDPYFGSPILKKRLFVRRTGVRPRDMQNGHGLSIAIMHRHPSLGEGKYLPFHFLGSSKQKDMTENHSARIWNEPDLVLRLSKTRNMFLVSFVLATMLIRTA